MTRDNLIADRPARPLAAASLFIGAVALLGFDLMYSNGPNRSHRATATIVHAIAPANSAAIAIPTALAGSAGVLALMLWLGRHGAEVLRQLVPIEMSAAPALAKLPPTLQSRYSITYHTGGLYGP